MAGVATGAPPSFGAAHQRPITLSAKVGNARWSALWDGSVQRIRMFLRMLAPPNTVDTTSAMAELAMTVSTKKPLTQASQIRGPRWPSNGVQTCLPRSATSTWRRRWATSSRACSAALPPARCAPEGLRRRPSPHRRPHAPPALLRRPGHETPEAHVDKRCGSFRALAKRMKEGSNWREARDQANAASGMQIGGHAATPEERRRLAETRRCGCEFLHSPVLPPRTWHAIRALTFPRRTRDACGWRSSAWPARDKLKVTSGVWEGVTRDNLYTIFQVVEVCPRFLCWSTTSTSWGGTPDLADEVADAEAGAAARLAENAYACR